MKVRNARDKRAAGETGTQPGLGRAVTKGSPTAISDITPMSSKSLKIMILITASFDESIQRKNPGRFQKKDPILLG